MEENAMFFVVNMQRLANGTAQNVTGHKSEPEGRSTFHSVIASNYAAKEVGNLEGFAVTLLENGRYVDSEEFEME